MFVLGFFSHRFKQQINSRKNPFTCFHKYQTWQNFLHQFSSHKHKNMDHQKDSILYNNDIRE